MKWFLVHPKLNSSTKNQPIVHEPQSPFSWFTSSTFLSICLVGHITQAALDKKNEYLRSERRLKKKYNEENKSLISKQELWAAQIGNLTMALHNERRQVNSASEVIQLPKRGRPQDTEK